MPRIVFFLGRQWLFCCTMKASVGTFPTLAGSSTHRDQEVVAPIVLVTLRLLQQCKNSFISTAQ
jgi:hypothetical protein